MTTIADARLVLAVSEPPCSAGRVPAKHACVRIAAWREGFVTRFVPLSTSRVKRETNNTDLFVHRRPELYDILVRPTAESPRTVAVSSS